MLLWEYMKVNRERKFFSKSGANREVFFFSKSGATFAFQPFIIVCARGREGRSPSAHVAESFPSGPRLKRRAATRGNDVSNLSLFLSDGCITEKNHLLYSSVEKLDEFETSWFISFLTGTTCLFCSICCLFPIFSLSRFLFPVFSLYPIFFISFSLYPIFSLSHFLSILFSHVTLFSPCYFYHIPSLRFQLSVPFYLSILFSLSHFLFLSPFH